MLFQTTSYKFYFKKYEKISVQLAELKGRSLHASSLGMTLIIPFLYHFSGATERIIKMQEILICRLMLYAENVSPTIKRSLSLSHFSFKANFYIKNIFL